MPERMRFDDPVNKQMQFEKYVLNLVKRYADKEGLSVTFFINRALVLHLKREKHKLREIGDYYKREGNWYHKKVAGEFGELHMRKLSEYEVKKFVHGEDMAFEDTQEKERKKEEKIKKQMKDELDERNLFENMVRVDREKERRELLDLPPMTKDEENDLYEKYEKEADTDSVNMDDDDFLN